MTNPNTYSAPWRYSYRGFLAMCQALRFDLEPYQRRIARAVFGPEREIVAILPRGAGKSTLGALLALHCLAALPDSSVAVGSTSRGQASIVHDLLARWGDHPALDGRLRTLAVMGDWPAARFDGGGVLSVISGRGSRAVGRTDDLMLVDEGWALGNAARQGDDLLGALQTSLAKARDGKQPRGRLVVISTAAPNLDSPLGRMRARAMAGQVTRSGGHVRARVPGILAWEEWSVPDDRDLDDVRAVKLANPQRWATLDVLREARQRCAPLDFAMHHACRWGVGEATWLPDGAWTACHDPDLHVADGEEVVLAVDVGGARATTALVAVTPDLRVAHVDVRTGDDAVLDLAAAIPALAHRFNVREVAYDPWRFHESAKQLERDGLRVVEFPQSHSRMVPASETLHAAVVERRLRHPGHPDLDRHVANAVAKSTPRGWRLDRPGRDAPPIDAAVALAMAVDRASAPKPAPFEYLVV